MSAAEPMEADVTLDGTSLRVGIVGERLLSVGDIAIVMGVKSERMARKIIGEAKGFPKPVQHEFQSGQESERRWLATEVMAYMRSLARRRSPAQSSSRAMSSARSR